MPAAGKTGTTNNDNDKWFVGYTPYYVGAVWYGFDQNASIRNAGVTTNISAKLWGMVMEKVHSDLPVKEFSVPPGVVEAKICTKSGKLANSGCTSSVEYFISGTEPTKHCTNHGSAAKKNETPSPSAKNETDDARVKQIKANPRMSHRRQPKSRRTAVRRIRWKFRMMLR